LPLLRLHLLHHRRAAADDLPNPNLERKIAVLREVGRRRAGAECQLLRHREAIFAAFLHASHRLGKAGENLVHGEGLGAAVGLAAVEDGAVVGGQDIVEERSIGAADRLALAGLDLAELQAALGDDRAERARANPREADACSDDEEESEPERGRPAAVGGAVCSFGDRHCEAR